VAKNKPTLDRPKKNGVAVAGFYLFIFFWFCLPSPFFNSCSAQTDGFPPPQKGKMNHKSETKKKKKKKLKGLHIRVLE
jgi:hypothetical protein